MDHGINESISSTIQQEDEHEEVDAEDNELLLVKHVDPKIDEDNVDQGEKGVDLEKDGLVVEVVHDQSNMHENLELGDVVGKKENELVDFNLGE